jgi:hypothetical protein
MSSRYSRHAPHLLFLVKNPNAEAMPWTTAWGVSPGGTVSLSGSAHSSFQEVLSEGWDTHPPLILQAHYIQITICYL